MAAIVVVEHDPDFAAWMKLVLERVGHTVVLVRDGPQALARIGPGGPALMITAHELPGMNGTQLADELSRVGFEPRTRMILVTAYDSLPEAIALRERVAAWLYKPVQADMLVKRVEDTLATLVGPPGTQQ